MQASCRFVFRLLRSSKHPSSSITVNSSFNNLSQSIFLDPQNKGFFQFNPYTTITGQFRGSKRFILLGFVLPTDDPITYQHHTHFYSSHRSFFTRAKQIKKIEINDQHSQRAVTIALWCNFLVFSLKFGVWLTTSSHVMLAEMVHSVADFANQVMLAYGLSSSRRAPDAIHPYGYSKERFVWSLISAVGIFCLGSGATIVHGVQNLWTSHPPTNIEYAALVIGGSFIIEGASLVVAIQAVKKGAAAEGMKVRDYVWRGHDPTSVAVMTEVAIFLIQRNRHALIGRAIDEHDTQKVLHFLKNDLVVDAIYDCKSEVIGPGFFRFKAEIDFNGVVVVQNYLDRTGREEWAGQFREAAKEKDDSALLKIMSNYGEEVVTALGSEVDRLEKEIQELVPGIRHVDIEAHNPIDLSS
ncbi:metal tolerance protein C4-like isoform X2 [Durio zibethinus]|uniref:Metal tolerance protein C4-like isoform X2 n=1 Tax=Durio zibethinus TaxID=66656 RepID=A0A6P5WK85_DURZI|nr:metal tolerance protein C4-like isoform X2 [Durio zibethinus]